MPKYGIILKLPKGSSTPAGFTLVKSLRTVNVYKKNAPKPVPQADVDALIEGLAQLNISARASAVNDLDRAMAALNVNEGGARKTRRRRGRGRGRKGTRRV